MDITNRIVKICRRIDDINFMLLAYRNDKQNKIAINLSNELDKLNSEFETLRPAIAQDKPFAEFVV